MKMKEREFTFSATLSLPSPSSDLKVPIGKNQRRAQFNSYVNCSGGSRGGGPLFLD